MASRGDYRACGRLLWMLLLTASLLLVRLRTIMVIKIGRIRSSNAGRRPDHLLRAVRRLIQGVQVNSATLMR